MAFTLEHLGQIYTPESANLETPAWEAALQLAEAIDETEQLPISILHAVEHVQEYLERLPQMIANESLDLTDDFTEHLTLISHAISTFLYNCIKEGKPWAAQFLFPHNFSIAETKVNLSGRETPSLEAFGRLHMLRNIRMAGQIYQRMFIEAGQEGSIHFVEGPMYASKTGLSKVLWNMLSLDQQNGVRTKVFIFEGMHEEELHARSVRGENIAATQVGIESLRDEISRFVDELERGNQTGIIFVEEATFFSFKPDEVEQFIQLIMEAKKTGLHIILTGLNRDFKGRELPISNALHANMNEAHFYDCRSYVLLCGRDGIFLDQSHEEADSGDFTSRVNVEMGDPDEGLYGVYDFLLPTLVPRVGSARIVKYLPTPSMYHPMVVIGRVNPDLYTKIVNKEQPQVLRYYERKYHATEA